MGMEQNPPPMGWRWVGWGGVGAESLSRRSQTSIIINAYSFLDRGCLKPPCPSGKENWLRGRMGEGRSVGSLGTVTLKSPKLAATFILSQSSSALPWHRIVSF